MIPLRLLRFVLLPTMIGGGASAQGLPPAISATGAPAALAMAVQGARNAIPIVSADPNNAAFSDWTPYTIGASYAASQLAGARAVELDISNPGTLTFTSTTGNAMTLTYAATGAYAVPFVPARIDPGPGTAAVAWLLR